MTDFLLILVIIAITVPGFFVMWKLDKFLDKKGKMKNKDWENPDSDHMDKKQ